MATAQTLDGYIEQTPGVLGGKPRIAGRRIAVQHVAAWHERMGMSADAIAMEYDLSLAEVYAALTYYWDHRAEIDEAIVPVPPLPLRCAPGRPRRSGRSSMALRISF